MAGMTDSLGYDHPHYTILRQQIIESQGPASAIDFCVFRCRTKAIMKYIHIKCISAPSVASGQLEITHTGSNQYVETVSSASLVAGASYGYTCVSSNTLVTITDTYALQLSGTDLGKWSVLYEYQVVPEWTAE